jgi:Ca2+-binding RTX toxin-like protein
VTAASDPPLLLKIFLPAILSASDGSVKIPVIIAAGLGDDTITYNVSRGTDTASIDGGDGNDTLIVNHNGQPFLIRDTAGNVIYQFGSGGTTTITVANVEHITVKDSNGFPVFTWP